MSLKEKTVANILLTLAFVFLPQLAAAQTNTFPSSGDVGVGTTTPDQYANIHISKGPGAGMDIQASDTAGWARLRLRTSTRIWGWFAGDASQPDAPNKIGLYDYTAGAFRMMFDTSGNVGIGTNSPTSRLHIGGTNDNLFSVVSTGSAANDTVAHFSSAVGTNLIVRANGNVGIGTTDPSLGGVVGSRFTVTQADASTGFSLGNTAGTPRFALNGNSNGTWTMFDYGSSAWTAGITQKSGSVGIGNVNPNYKLDVNGEINATGLRINGTPISGGGGSSQWTGTSSIYYNGGNVGIGTTTPATKLELASNSAIKLGNAFFSSGGDYVHLANNEWYNGASWTASAAGALIQISGQDVNFYRHDAAGSHTLSMNINSSGNVGIGTTSPLTEKLQVVGNGKFTGNVTVEGTINAKYQDVAEWVPSSEELAAATVVILDPTKSNQVVSSATAYDTRVAGVISAQPGITLGEGGEGKVLVATTGRVRVKVDASRSPIQIGDLLVTSDVTGVAMKSEAVNLGGVQIHRPGTIVGKALEPLAKGRGEILVLLSLQ